MARMDLGDIDVEVVGEDRCTVTFDVSRLVAKVDRLTAAVTEMGPAWRGEPWPPPGATLVAGCGAPWQDTSEGRT